VLRGDVEKGGDRKSRILLQITGGSNKTKKEGEERAEDSGGKRALVFA
jgi:hypothetical protein